MAAKHVFGVSEQLTRRLIVGHFNQEGLHQLMKTCVVKTTYNLTPFVGSYVMRLGG